MRYENFGVILSRLRSVELTSDLVVRSQRFISEAPALKRVVMKKQPEIFFPPFVDKLYWCFFIMKEGMAAFEGLGKGVFAAETSSKISMVQDIRKKTDLLATYKKKCCIASSESDLVGCPFITMDTFQILCIVYGISVLVAKGKRAVRFQYSDQDPYIVWCCESGYGLGSDRIEHGKLPEGVVEVQDLEKPLKAIGSYKKEDLVSIATTVGISLGTDAGKTKSKADLYQGILEAL